MYYTANTSSSMTLSEYAQQEYMSAPLTEMLHARFPKPLSVFLKTAALSEGLTESTVIRFACQQWASTQGYTSSCI